MDINRELDLKGTGSFWDKLKGGFDDRYSEGREDYRNAYYAAREAKEKDYEATRISTTLGTNPTLTTARDLIHRWRGDIKLGKNHYLGSNPADRNARRERGMGLADDNTIALGQVLGTLGNDLTQDHSRSIWWLLNAPQATGNVINEIALATANPDLFKGETFSLDPKVKDSETRVNVVDMDGSKPRVYKGQNRKTEINQKNYERALELGLINREGVMQKGTSRNSKNQYVRRKYHPGHVAALGIAPGVAINAGIGLLNPFGGSGGYAAVLPSDDDPSATSNVIAEVGAKYILGKTGNLLPYDEFVKHRPDVSKEDYNRYKAFKYDKEGDINIFDDGKVTLPTGIVKFTTEGIHGPELQFLGRSLPATTTLLPFLGAVAGGAVGVRNKRAIRGGLIGGSAGLALGSGTGIIAEEIRRRAVSNQQQEQGGSAEMYL